MKKVLMYAFIVLAICLFGYFSFPKEKVHKQEIENISLKEGKVQEQEEKEEKKEVDHFFVDIKGEVNSPGVYEVISTERVKDVIEKSGGLKENADTMYINLSQKVKDEMVIFVYSKEESKQIKENNSQIKNSYIYKNNDALITYEKENTSKVSKSAFQNAYPVNINISSKEELMTIPGIGESKADLIIAYREEHPFETIEDIKNIKGIGDTTFEKLKSYITV